MNDNGGVSGTSRRVQRVVDHIWVLAARRGRRGARERGPNRLKPRISHPHDVGSVCDRWNRSGANVRHRVATGPSERPKSIKPPLDGLKPGARNDNRSPFATTNGSPQTLGRTLGLESTMAHQTRDAAGNAHATSDGHGLGSRHFKQEVLLEVEDDEVYHLCNDPDRNLGRGRCCDREVINVQHQLRQRPIAISDDDNIDEKNPQLRRRHARPRCYAARCNEQVGENTFNPDGPLHAVRGQRKPEKHEGVAFACCRSREQVVRDPLERLDQIKKRNRVLLCTEGRRLSTERHRPSSSLRTHTSASKQLRHGMRGLPSPRMHGARAHPQPDDGWEKPNGPEPPVGLRQKHNEHEADRLTPRAQCFRRRKNHRERHQGLIGEPG
jgi:hypothetical protein